MIAGVALVGLALAAGAAALFTLRSVDWSEYEEELVSLVGDATGRELVLEDGFSLHLGLSPQVDVHGLRFENAAWGSRPEMATLERLSLRARLLPLLFGEVELSHVELVGLDVVLEVGPEGRPNWSWSFDAEKPGDARPDDEDDGDGAGSGTPRKPKPSPSGAGSGGLGALPVSTVIRRAVIEDARITYRTHQRKSGDEATAQTLYVEHFRADGRGRNAPMEVELRALYQDEPIELDGRFEGVSELLAGGPLGLELEAAAGGLALELSGQIGAPLEVREVDLRIRAQGESLASLSPLAGRSLPGLGPYSIQFRALGDRSEFRADDFELRIGASEIAGWLAAKLSGERPRIDAELRSPRLDLADLRGREAPPARTQASISAPPPGSASAQAPAPTPKRSSGRIFPADPLPLSVFSALDAGLALEVTQLSGDGLELANLMLHLDLEAGRAKLEPFGTHWGGGRVEGVVELDSGGTLPRMSTTLTLRGIDVGALSRSRGNTSLDGGRLDLDTQLRGQGRSIRAIMASLSGQLSLELGPGTIRNDWAERVFTDVVAAAQTGEGRQAAEVHCAIGDFRIRSGVARPEYLVLDTPALSLFGDGDVDLGRESLGLRFDRKATSLSASSVLPPFKLGGSFAAPAPAIDATALGNKVVDLGAVLLQGGPRSGGVSADSGPARCKQVLARYEQSLEDRAAAKQQAADTAKDVGREARGAFDQIKGLFDRD